MKRLLALSWVAFAAVLVGCLPGASAWAGTMHQPWNWSGTLAAGRTLEVNGVNGSIVAAPGAGNRVLVSADKIGRGIDPAAVEIRVTQDSDGITICAMYPGQGSACGHSKGPRLSHGQEVEVHFRVTVPAGVALTANTVNGDVQVRGLTGRVQAKTVNGGCDIETAGSGEASTVNGAVNATIGRLSPRDELSFNTVNGSITLRLADNVNAEVSGSTVNGGIKTDFPIVVSKGWGPRSASGTLGKGGAKLSASTVNGSIHLERASAQ